MNQTNALFLKNSYLFASLCRIQEAGIDEEGNYLVVDQTIFYPQGGGQPGDIGHLSYGHNDIKIIRAKYTDSGIRHYLSSPIPKELVNTEIAMYICQDTRRLNAAYHTAGHWLSQVIMEGMQLPLFPVKGHHFPGEAYLEFEGDIHAITSNTIDEMRMVMQIDLQSNLKVIIQFANEGSMLFRSAVVPKNFNPPKNKPLRFSQIEGYKWIPCGGTHVEHLREIKSVVPLMFYVKNGRLRLKYKCELSGMIAS